MGWQMTAMWIGAIAAVIGQWWGMDFYLSAIGGVLVGIALLVK